MILTEEEIEILDEISKVESVKNIINPIITEEHIKKRNSFRNFLASNKRFQTIAEKKGYLPGSIIENDGIKMKIGYGMGFLTLTNSYVVGCMTVEDNSYCSCVPIYNRKTKKWTKLIQKSDDSNNFLTQIYNF